MISVMHYWLFHLEYYYFDNQSGQFQFCNVSQINWFSLSPIGDSKKGVTVLEGGRVLARGTGSCT